MEFRFVIIDGKIYNDDLCRPLPSEVCGILIEIALANTNFHLEDFNESFLQELTSSVYQRKPVKERVRIYEESSTGRIKICNTHQEGLDQIFATNAPKGRTAALHEHFKSKSLGGDWFDLNEDEVGDAIVYGHEEDYAEWAKERQEYLDQYMEKNPRFSSVHAKLLDKVIERKTRHMLDIELSDIEDELT